MASLILQGDRYRLDFTHHGKRRSVYIGMLQPKQAEAIKGHIENLIGASVSGLLSPATGEWVRTLPDQLHGKLARLGLVPSRARTDSTVGKLLAAFLEALDVKPSTRVRIEQTRDHLESTLGKNTPAASIDEARADAWRAKMREEGYASATIARNVLHARQVWRWGMRRGMVNGNPFAQIKAGSQTNPARSVFVPRDVIAKVIDAAPDAEWRLMIALSRYGGLRVPSEALALRWSDVDLAANRMTVRSPKTAHHAGGAERVVPIFPELQGLMLEAFHAAPDGAEFVIGRYREGSNLNPELRRIIRRAGVTCWERAWHNLRASRQTELAQDFPIHVVCAWLGNSRMIAQGHYLRVLDADFQRATVKLTEKATETTSVQKGTHESAKSKTPPFQRGLRVGAPECAHGESGEVVATGLEPVTPVV